MMRRIVIVVILAVPALLFANAFQAYRYSRLEREIALLNETQQTLIEENKRDILAISVLSSPQRIGPLALEELGLERITEGQIIRMKRPGTETLR